MTAALELQIDRPGKPPRTFPIEPDVYTIGSDDDCRIQLPHEDVDSRHAVLTVRADASWIEDLGTTHGTSVAGARVEGRAAVGAGQEIRIGPFCLAVRPIGGVATPPAPPPPPEPVAKTTAPTLNTEGETPAEQRRSIKQQIHRELVERLDIKRLSASRLGKGELEARVRQTIESIVDEVSGRLPPSLTPAALVKELYDEAMGLGPLEDLLEDDEITEIMVNGHEQVYVEKGGKLVQTDSSFMDDASVLAIIERIVSPLGRRIDESQPYVDARLPDGSRVNAVIPPLSLVGPCLTVRKFSKTPFTAQDFVKFSTWTPQVMSFSQACVLLRKNIVISGGTGSGKTSLLNIMSSYIPDTERIVTIEDAAELRLGQDHIIRLEARPPNIEGRGAITIRDLVRNALRMRPDRIVVGECRGGEALDMLQAMNTGHDGSLTTVHANSPRDVISRLETMVLMSGMDLPVRAIREQIAAAIDIIVHESRFSDGSRKVVKVTEIVGQEGDQITMQDIFEYVQTGVTEEGKVLGHFKPTGAVPTFLEDLTARGLSIDRTMFDPQFAGEDIP